MPTTIKLPRRSFLKGAGAFVAMSLAGCDRLTNDPSARKLLGSAEDLNMRIQRGILGRSALAAEFGEGDLSKTFKANGTIDPTTIEYRNLGRGNFSDWRLKVGGLVEHPATFSLQDLRDMPARTQITRHDCVEGWSCIGKWTGARLQAVLNRVGLKANARYIVVHCMDRFPTGSLSGPEPYYESIDLDDAFHEQTILAYDMNGAALTVAHGAPLRLRVERQLGYKHAKYISALEAVESTEKFGNGNGSFWADHGYSWYAGI